MADENRLDVQVETQEQTIIVRPVGDIDLACSPTLRSELMRVQGERFVRIVVDLSAVPYMDSSGVATLVEAMQIALRNGTRLVLCGLQDRVRSIFEIARLDSVFTIAGSQEDALTV
ncbi:MAG: anti-sigma factor antagonist [Planctomycetes bacterium]|nr:anti-sigma factor antagonist [Planctomycetota bacterium]NOG53947.1 STAS domain-containing protein [Planctomycetota bacterium]